MAKTKKIEIFDTTLRDGTQAEDISFTVEDKLRLCEKLDWLGVDYIEAGWPGSNPKDTEFFERAQNELNLKHAQLTAFGSTKRAGRRVEDDFIVSQMLAANTPVICLFGKTWDFHVTKTLRIPLEENLELIRDTILYLKKYRKEVLFDAEHFFDGYKQNRAYALKALQAAKAGGADRLVLCDTNGGTLPDEVFRIVREVVKKLRVPVGIHCHDDCGLGVANSISAVSAGATQVQGTMNGIGERCGNANLCSVMATLELKMGYQTVGPQKLKRLAETSQFINELANLAGNKHQAYVGRSAFAHKGGVHVSAVLKDAKTYEHIDPAKVGNEQRILLSDLSGGATIVKKAKEFGITLEPNNPRVKQMLADLKQLENRGYQFEGAEASFEMALKKAMGLYKPHFQLHDFKVIDEILAGLQGEPSSTAVIHLSVDGHDERASARGVGPVHAIDQALRAALERFYPEVQTMRLLDYKVRVLPAGQGTASSVRVLIECGDATRTWGTVGVSENIIHASYQALMDAFDYKIMQMVRK